MADKSTVRSDDLRKSLTVANGTTLRELMKKILKDDDTSDVGAAFVNNESTSLDYAINNDVTVRYMTTKETEGRRVYVRTFVLMLYAAVVELYPAAKLKVNFSVGDGLFFSVDGVDPVKDLSPHLKRRIRQIIAEDIKIDHNLVYCEEAQKLFEKEKLHDKLSLIETRKRLYYNIDVFSEHYGYMYGTTGDRTSIIKEFDIVRFMNGYILVLPDRTDSGLSYAIDATKLKMYELFLQFKEWQDLQNLPNMGSLNKAIREGRADEIIKISEARQEKVLAHMADDVMDNIRQGVKLILISGPSSSGKTTFSKKLNIQLRVFGITPIIISMDDYFVERDQTPLDENGQKDYDSISAVDVDLFQEHLIQLLAGEEVSMPTYNFITGKREYNGDYLKMEDRSVIIVEGIHALNPDISSHIDRNLIYKLYVSALTSISMDDTTYFSTTDNRLLRRIVRDAKYRNRSCEETLRWWAGVRRGEDKYIFPFQNEADKLFSSALLYEINVLKVLAEPLLLEVPNTAPEYAEASRLLNILSYLAPVDMDLVPPGSLLREFIGGSSY